MSFVPQSVAELVARIADVLVARNQTIAVSEAACGGILSAYLVSRPGASQFFQGGTLVYSLKSKLKLSGWSEKEILSYTGPSEDSVLKQARNLRMELGSSYSLSESGFAGPDTAIEGVAESGNKEVGTVFFGICGPKGSVAVEKKTGLTGRVENMEEFARLGLIFLLEVLEGEQGAGGD